LRGLNQTFRHQTVTAKQVRDFMSKTTGVDLTRIFVQYQETTMIPVLEYKVEQGTLRYRWSQVIPKFDMPVDLVLPSGGTTRLKPTEQWQSMPSPLPEGVAVEVAPQFYVTVKTAD
jgi:aminopeptidase N